MLLVIVKSLLLEPKVTPVTAVTSLQKFQYIGYHRMNPKLGQIVAFIGK